MTIATDLAKKLNAGLSSIVGEEKLPDVEKVEKQSQSKTGVKSASQTDEEDLLVAQLDEDTNGMATALKENRDEQVDAYRLQLQLLDKQLKSVENQRRMLLSNLGSDECNVASAIQSFTSLNSKVMEVYSQVMQISQNIKNANTQFTADITSIQAQLDSLNSQTSALQSSIGNFVSAGSGGTGSADVVNYASQFDGKSASEMANIMQGKGYQYDSGAWCADFCAFVIGETKGQSAPSWYQNCSNKAYCPTVEQAGKAAGAQIEIANAKPGDLVLFDWGGDGTSDHIGIVESVNSDGTVNTIEGNTSLGSGSQCARRKRSPSTIRCVLSMA